MARQPLISHIIQITHGTEAELKKACIAMQQVKDIYSKQKVPSLRVVCG